MDLDLEEIGLMLVNNYALLLQNYTSINTLMAAENIYIIDACFEHTKYRVDIFSIRSFQIIWIKKEQLRHVISLTKKSNCNSNRNSYWLSNWIPVGFSTGIPVGSYRKLAQFPIGIPIKSNWNSHSLQLEFPLNPTGISIESNRNSH